MRLLTFRDPFLEIQLLLMVVVLSLQILLASPLGLYENDSGSVIYNVANVDQGLK